MPDEEDRQQELERDGDDGLGEVEINDGTSPQQVELERKIMDGETVEDVSDDGKPDQPEAQAPEPETTAVRPEAPQPRTYSEEEFRKAQSAWTRQIQERQEQIERFNMEAAIEAQLRDLKQRAAPVLGEEEAERQVQQPRVREALQRRYIQNQELESLKAHVYQQEFQNATTKAVEGIGAFMKQLKTEHKLTDADLSEMAHVIPRAAFESPDTFVEMGGNLKRWAMQREKLRTNQRVPPETPQTRLESGRASGDGRETAAQRIDRLNFTPTEQWSEADERFMQTGKMR